MAYLGGYNGGGTFRKVPAPRLAYSTDIPLASTRGLGDLGQGWETALIAAAISLATWLANNKQVQNFFVGETYDAFLNYYNSVARSLGLPLGDDPQGLLGQILRTGTIPIYCSDSPGARDRIYENFGKLGWKGVRWSNRYQTGGGNTKWYYGITFKLNEAPQALIDQAYKEACSTDPNARMQESFKVYTDAMHHFKSYGGYVDDNDLSTFQQLAVTAIPISPEACAQLQTGGSGSASGSALGTDKPFYKKWWFWALVGGGTLVLTTTTILLLRRGKGKP